MAVSQRLYGRTGTLAFAALLVWASPQAATPETLWRVCQPHENRITCIVDGDTLWFQGEKMRLLGVDTPEMDGTCARERYLAIKAKYRLLELVSTGILTITRHGHDDYGRSLVSVETRAGMVGDLLLRDGLADRFGDDQLPRWCG